MVWLGFESWDYPNRQKNFLEKVAGNCITCCRVCWMHQRVAGFCWISFLLIAGSCCTFWCVSSRKLLAEREVAQGRSKSHWTEGAVTDFSLLELEIPAQFPCLLHIAMCSALCNESVIQYNPDKRIYEKIGESTEVALRLLAEKIGLPGFDTMPSALNMLSNYERASYCNRYWESQFKKVSVLEFSRDRKMMSVLCSRKQMEIMFSKGAPESILSRCINILCNDDGSTVPLSAHIRAQLEAKFNSFAGKETLRCLALALKRMPMGQQSLSFDDENDLTFIGLICSFIMNVAEAA
ncbi:Calcium-transporting ATPase 3, endoplasmic reticulum-type [Datura stramonium]|uniref:Calcium-transporting ATPase 3, endoplasmic reticulum-type n=1 Tax=Datura stramonium TaxID=4076 RepID=A0ABS8V3I2_DATST|nr:Calcium-transporting ATPase 3, endoplasmic reticulum-type [Datura stramonium]